MRRFVLLSLAVLAMSTATVADEVSHREAAHRVLEASQAEKSLDQVLEIFDGMLAQQMASLDLPAEGQEAAREMQAEMTSWMTDLLRWEEMSAFLETMYVEVFSEEELNQLADFYDSEIGQKLLERQPEILQKTMEWTQGQVAERMPEFLERVEARTKELEERFRTAEAPEG